MKELLKYIVRFALFVLVQVFVLDKIHLHQMITPYIYFLFIIWLPFKMQRTPLMLVAFLLGFSIDSFRHNPGFHAAACVLIAYIRPFLIKMLVAQDISETNYNEPSAKSMGGTGAYLFLVLVLTFLHNAWLFFLEAWQFGDICYFIVKTMLSTAISMLLIIIVELIFNRNQKFRTNTA